MNLTEVENELESKCDLRIPYPSVLISFWTSTGAALFLVPISHFVYGSAVSESFKPATLAGGVIQHFS